MHRSDLLLDLLCRYLSLSHIYKWCDCVDMCQLRRLKWIWFDFSLKLSTQSVRLNSSLRSFISFSEMKNKLQSLNWGRKKSRRSRWWRRSWRRSTDTSQLFHTQSKTQRRWWKPVMPAFWRSDFRWLIDWLMIELLMINGVFVLQEFPVSVERWVICWCLWSLCFWSKATAVLILNVLPESRSHHSRIHRCLLELWFMCHVTWATCPSESGRRCRTSSGTVSLTAEDPSSYTHTLEMMHEPGEYWHISALCVKNQPDDPLHQNQLLPFSMYIYMYM